LLDRDQTEISLFTVDATTGVSTRIQHETDPTWINLSPGTPRWLDDGSGYLWMTEANGHWVLERRNTVGALVAVLTEPSLGLRSVVGVDEKAGVAYVQASADPRQLHVYKISLTGTTASPALAINDLDSGGITTAVVKHGVMVLGSTLRTGGSRTVAIGRNGERSELPSVAELPSLQPTTQLSQVQAPATPEAPARSFYTAITRPRDFDASKTYPVLLKVYAGPHAIMVTDSRDAYLMDQWYADAGFIVVRADGRGTPHRGRAWERPILNDLITVPMQDQVAALQALAAAHPEMDMQRVGVFGWSFGGYFSTMAALLHGDIFKAAVAGAPVTDWELYDTAYTERYMKTPAANPDGYRRASALTHAAKLQRPLLVIHGITDDNVHFAHTLALIEALYVEGKRAEVVTLSATHMVPDPKLNLAREKVQVDFFRQHLASRS
jgi:dipeptidyl-peptidase 4